MPHQDSLKGENLPAVSFIILTWNSEQYIGNCLHSVTTSCDRDKIPFEILVIDNGSHDQTIAHLSLFQQTHSSLLHVIQLEHNAGTTFPRNLGLKKARGRYVCILDSDTELSGTSMLPLLELLDSQNDAGIVAPRLVLLDGTIQNSVKRFPTMLHKLKKVSGLLFGLKLRNDDFYENFPFEDVCEVDTAISACWFFRKELIEKIGCLDENIFYSPEDLDYSIRCWNAGFRILYYPSFTVLHHTQQITHKKPFSRVSLLHFQGLLYYYRKHGGWLRRKKSR